jgi:RND family efflux transporter MFP subunit
MCGAPVAQALRHVCAARRKAKTRCFEAACIHRREAPSLVANVPPVTRVIYWQRPLSPSAMRLRPYQWIVAILTVAVIGWLILRCASARDDASAPAESAAVERRVFASTVAAIGTVKPQIGAEVKVGSRISGRVRRLNANIGDAVRRGQVIAELETEELDALIAERSAEVQVAEAEVGAAAARIQLAAVELSRQEHLERQGVATNAEADLARERNGAALAYELAARAALVRAQAALEQMKVQRSFTTLHAPIAGVVASVATQEGETIAAGLNAPTFLTIVDLRRLQVDTYVDEVDIGKVKVGQRATFMVDAFPARDFTGTVAAIYPTATIQDNVVKYIAAVRIDDADGVLRPEMTANVRLELEAREVLAVPVRAVRRVDGRSVVYVGDPARPEARAVRVGWRDWGFVEITEGLQAGERVLLDVTPPTTGGAR